MKGEGTWRRREREREGSDPCKAHKTVPRWIRIQWARATGLLADRWGKNTGVREKATGQRIQVARTTQQPQGNWKTRGAGNRQRWLTGRGTWQSDVAGEHSGAGGTAEKTEQQPCGIGEPVAMEW